MVSSGNDIDPLNRLDCRRRVQSKLDLVLELKLKLEPEVVLELGQLELEDL